MVLSEIRNKQRNKKEEERTSIRIRIAGHLYGYNVHLHVQNLRLDWLNPVSSNSSRSRFQLASSPQPSKKREKLTKHKKIGKLTFNRIFLPSSFIGLLPLITWYVLKNHWYAPWKQYYCFLQFAILLKMVQNFQFTNFAFNPLYL